MTISHVQNILSKPIQNLLKYLQHVTVYRSTLSLYVMMKIWKT